MINIDWGAKIINVPKADLTLIQSNPVEIRELNLNDFRLALKDLEDGADGIAYLRTHNHNTEVLLGGIIYARVIEIINGYTITFEDGQYAVNLVGANSNVGDVVNVNQVSVRSANSAGLISSQAIEFSSFSGAVAIDVVNGVSGTLFPRGTLQMPVNNLDDAIQIAQFRGLSTFALTGTLVITNTDISRYTFKGTNSMSAAINLSGTGNITNGVTFSNLTIAGRIAGYIYAEYCGLQVISNVGSDSFPTIFHECVLRDDSGATPCISLRNGLTTPQNIHFIECICGVPEQDDNPPSPTVHLNSSDAHISFKKYSGCLQIKGCDQGMQCTIDLDQGTIHLDPTTVTNGTIKTRGVGRLVHSTTKVEIYSGTWNVGVTIINELVGAKLDELHQLQGLAPAKPMTVNKLTGARTVGDVSLEITGDDDIVIVERQ